MSKSQAGQVAAMLRRATKSEAEGLVRVGYVPRHGVVVEVIKNNETLDAVGETGAPLLPDDDEVAA